MANTPSTGGTSRFGSTAATTTSTTDSDTTGTVSDDTVSTASADTTDESTTTEEKHAPGEVWVQQVTVPEAEKVDEKARKQAEEEDALRRENPNRVVYRRAEEPKSDDA